MAAPAPGGPSVDELEAREAELFRTGPLSVLTTSVKTNSQVREREVEGGRGSQKPQRRPPKFVFRPPPPQPLLPPRLPRS